MNIAGQQTDYGEKIDNLHRFRFVLGLIRIGLGGINGMLLDLKRLVLIPVLKVIIPAPLFCPLLSNSNVIGYRGEHPFESLESLHMSKYISKTLQIQRNIRPIAYIDFHSYSQSILYPFAYDCDVLPRDAEDLAEAAWGAAKAARDVHGRYFDVDSACEGDNFGSVRIPSPFHKNLIHPPSLFPKPVCPKNLLHPFCGIVADFLYRDPR